MRYNDLLITLQNLIGKKPSQSEIARALGLKANAINGRAQRNSEFKIEELIKIEDWFGIAGFLTGDFAISSNDDYITVNYYPDVLASCGNGTFEMSQECIKYDVPATLLPPSQNTQGYSMCHARGNSMYPRIWDGDFIICEHGKNMKIKNGEIYIFCFEDQIYLKRLTKNINQIVVESENPDFPTQYIEKEQMNDVHLIGHVICSGRMNGKYMDKRV